VSVRRSTVVLWLVVMAVLMGGGPALAEPPFDVPGQITDRAGVLSAADEDRVQEALDRLRSDENLQLFVVYVDSFDGTAPTDWADATAEQSGFGGNDALFAVAVEDRRYGVSVDQIPLSDSELDDLLASDVEGALAEDDWAGAAVALADGLGGGGGNTALWVVGGVAVVGGGAYLVARSRRKKRAAAEATPSGPPDPHAGVPTDQLQGQASAALLELDEAVQSSQLELDFARVQYGDEAVTGFAEALGRSRAELGQAFTLRQQLDDEIAEDEPAQRRMLTEMLTLIETADDRLDDQAEAFEKLRDLERTAPQVLDALGPRVAELHGRIPVAEQRLTELRASYAESALLSVADNVTEATARLAAAEAEITEARGDLAAGQAAAAVSDVRAAEDAVAQTATLLDAVDSRAAELAAADGRIAAVRAETEKDLAEARALVQGGDRTGLTPQIARAEAALTEADAALGGARPDPLAALRRLEEADAALEQALGPAWDADARARRAAAGLEQNLAGARAAIGAASDFITTRRGAVGPEPRTRLAEAQRHLDAAVGLASTDPVIAQQEAQTAADLGRRALDQARRDLDTWSNEGVGYGGYAPGGFSGGYQRGGYRSGGGIDLGSLVLGGILSGGGGGGGYRSSGFGGGRRRSGGGFSSGGRRSSSRSSGGRRSRGGRF
jgi:hypothetical protein